MVLYVIIIKWWENGVGVTAAHRYKECIGIAGVKK